MLISVIVRLVDLYSLLIVIDALLSWFPAGNGVFGDIKNGISAIVNPYLNIFRKFIPPIGGTIDVSPIAAILVLQLAARLLYMIF